jgi:hypothetical protein
MTDDDDDDDYSLLEFLSTPTTHSTESIGTRQVELGAPKNNVGAITVAETNYRYDTSR